MVPKRVDNNQAEIVRALRDVGASVTCTHEIGHGFPDLAVGFRGITLLLEVKSSKGKLTPDEQEWRDGWRGQCYTVRSVLDALECLKGL